MGNKTIKILGYTVTFIIIHTENGLQRLLKQTDCRKVQINTEKTKCLTLSDTNYRLKK